MMSTNIENQDTIIFLIRHTKTKSAGFPHALVFCFKLFPFLSWKIFLFQS